MCGRFTLRTPAGEIVTQFGLRELADFAARFNIAPTQSVLTIRLAPTLDANDNPPANRRLSANPQAADWEGVWMYWGLVPSWAKEKSIGASLINARSETAAEKPSFRSAFKHRRCLVVSDGFYEWKAEGKRKQPFHIHSSKAKIIAFAGLWELWKGEDPSLQSCTILTSEARGDMEKLHHRAPVMLAPDEYADWLSPNTSAERLKELLAPADHTDLEFTAVSTHVNNARNNDANCLAAAQPTLF